MHRPSSSSKCCAPNREGKVFIDTDQSKLGHKIFIFCYHLGKKICEELGMQAKDVLMCAVVSGHDGKDWTGLQPTKSTIAC